MSGTKIIIESQDKADKLTSVLSKNKVNFSIISIKSNLFRITSRKQITTLTALLQKKYPEIFNEKSFIIKEKL
jgi:hypothetical protein